MTLTISHQRVNQGTNQKIRIPQMPSPWEHMSSQYDQNQTRSKRVTGTIL